MPPARQILLEFDPALDAVGQGKLLRDGLSAVERIGDSLWIANDETRSIERLGPMPDTDGSAPARCAGHASFALDEYLDPPTASRADPETREEADLEGLAFAQGYLWLVGSHSLKRKTPKAKDTGKQAARQLAHIGCDGNRYLLARIPIVPDRGTWRPTKQDRERRAARLVGDRNGDALTCGLADDEHLSPFLAIPGKDNGFDIEGLAVIDDRLMLGLRGPVLRGWAVILELEPEADSLGYLGLRPFPRERRPYLKHFLQLGGLGVRDLCRRGDDLLILAGPTMDLDGPVRVLLWRGGATRHKAGETLPADRLEPVLDIPYGRREDHAEGMTLLGPTAGAETALLVVYDAPSAHRKRGGNAVLADVFPLAAA